MTTPSLDADKASVERAIERRKDDLVSLAKRIHAHPEVAFEEVRAMQWVSTLVGDAGFEVKHPLAGLETAFVATYEGKRPVPTIAFLAEYDALPKLGHACGHNLIAAASVGAALGVAEGVQDFAGTIQLIGTPAEEGGGGKVILADAGVFDGIDAAMMFHPSARTILWQHGLARRKLSIEFFGRAAHASGCPEDGINALDATLQTFASINALRQHIPGTSRIHGIVTDGGAAPNIVPDHSASLFYVRAFDDETCDELLEKVKHCAQGAATATGAELHFEMQGSYKALRTNLTLADAFRKNVESLGWQFETTDPTKRIGSTDVANVSHVVPAIHPYLSIGPSDLPGHSIAFAEAAASDKGHEAMLAAAKALAMTAVDLMHKPDLLGAVTKEFRETS